MKNFFINKVLWILTAIIVLICAIAGVVNPGIYTKVMAEDLMPAAMAQDILSIFVAAILLILIIKAKSQSTKLQIVIIGMIGSLAYLYAIFSIERVYNWFYLFYLAILGLSLYSIPFSIGSINKEENFKMPKIMKWTSIIFSGFIGILFCFLWISSLIPAMSTGQKIELYYSIYILDLVWIMPGFLITAVMSYFNKSIGFLLTVAMYILGIFVIFPLGLGELAKPFYGDQINLSSMIMSFVLSGTFLLMTGLQLFFLKKDD